MLDPAPLLLDVYSRSDNALLRATLPAVLADPRGFSQRFYADLFARAPGLRQLFPDDMSQQEMKLVQTLGVVAASLDRPESLLPVLRELGRRHRGYGVKAMHYRDVGESLLAALAIVNGADFDESAAEAWQRLYAHVARVMQS